MFDGSILFCLCCCLLRGKLQTYEDASLRSFYLGYLIFTLFQYHTFYLKLNWNTFHFLNLHN